MPITSGHSFLVGPPPNGTPKQKINGVRIELEGKLFTMLTELFEGADSDNDIEIAFRTTGGKQENPCRTLLLDYLANPTMKAGRDLAQRLQSFTDHRSRLGLMFVVAGTHKDRFQLLIARVPADEGVVATEAGEDLQLSFVERVFMKNLHAYKSALYHCKTIKTGFWNGWSIDRQRRGGLGAVLSNYWIGQFLDSEFRETGPAGTRRLANALRAASDRTQDDDVRDELWAAARMLRNQNGNRVSINSLGDDLRLSPETMNAIRDELPNPESANTKFQFNTEEYDSWISFRSVSLDTGVRLIGPNENFERHVKSQAADGPDGKVRFVTEGRVVNKKVGKAG
jgi:hypothetical protein